MPTSLRPSGRRFFPDVRTESLERTQDGVTLMQSVHTPASPRAWQKSGQSISIDGKFNTGARFPPRQHTKVEHPSMNQDHIKIRRTTSEVLNTATPTTSANLYDHLKVKPKRSKASANISKIRFTDGLRNAQYMDHPDTSNNITMPDMAGAWLKEKKSKQENPVIDKNNSSEDGKDIMPDRNEQYPSPRDTDDHSPGPNDGHQGMHETTLGHVKLEPTPSMNIGQRRGRNDRKLLCYTYHMSQNQTQCSVCLSCG